MAATALKTVLDFPGVWRAGRESFAPAGISTGYALLDQSLPGGGWPCGCLTEMIVPRFGIGEISLLLPALALLSQKPQWLVWLNPPYEPYAVSLRSRGVAINRLVIVRPKSHRDALWTYEQLLRSGSVSAVLAWISDSDDRALRRFQLAAEAGGAFSVIFTRTVGGASFAPLRLALAALKRQRLRIDILKRRGSRLPPFVLDV